VDVIYTDFAKAFDTVLHRVLVAKLESIGFHSSFLRWIASYLRDRKCFVKIDGQVSGSFFASSGVPQGSILGPLLFLFFINDIVLKIRHSQVLLYAHDLKLFRPINGADDIYLLQDDLNEVVSWCQSNHLYLNVLKCCSMSLSKSKSMIESIYFIKNCRLNKVDNMLDLGVVFDSKLMFNKHLDYIIPKAYKALALIRRHGTKFTDPYTFKSLYSAFVRSRLAYAAIIWSPVASIHVNRVERVQRVFTKMALRYLFRKVDMPAYNARILLIGLQPLDTRRKLMSIIFIFDLVNGNIQSPCLLSALNFYVPARSLRYNDIFYINWRTKYIANEPLNRAMLLYNNLSRSHLLDFSASRFSFKQFIASIL
jgi:hypothetical protein